MRARTFTGRTAASGQGHAYHHGHLRQALLAAAQSVLDERGLEGFTLRECARRAGVSHAAPAHHFGDAAGLLTAFAALGLRQLEARMRRRAAAPASPEAQWRAGALAYIEFAMAHRAHFQLMFRGDRLLPGDVELALARQDVAGRWSAALSAVLAARRIELDAEAFAARLQLAWSSVHGFAVLLLEGQGSGPRGRRALAAYAAAGGRMLALLEPAVFAPAAPAPASAAGPARRRTA
ncbi:transcriptional regulator BetI [Pigmentiphaga humi]|uniref:Transcriptional regulator BetI n=1 Tax=Pigmentiphaga humi TaxID=2478468 RepID=A0A3P4B4N8_9BURK|nr:TetR/AcrR family transcriptional regulator [Pigmentiphaga humi]VCU71257.1 transcriptional regulator BetI [Pigmentiphaga humi]